MEGLQGQMEQTDSLLARATKRVEAAYAAALGAYNLYHGVGASCL